MMRKLSTLLLAVLIAATAAKDASANNAIARYVFEDGEIYPIRAGLGIATTIELDPNDPVQDFSTGFSGGWEIVRRNTIFYIKPKNVDVDTNMIVRTQRRSYIFELQVAATDWRKLDDARRRGVAYRVVFDYPVDPAAEAAAQAQAEAQAKAAEEQVGAAQGEEIEPTRSYHYDYDVSSRTKRNWLIPSNVFDDGRFTYIRLPNPENIPSGNWPTVYGRNGRHDEDFIVNSNVEGNTIVVHGIYPFLVIRHGMETVGLRRNPVE